MALANPLTWHLLTFPFVALQQAVDVPGHRRVALARTSRTATRSLRSVFIVAGLLVLMRARLPWADTLPVLGFLASALIAERNLAPFGVVLAPGARSRPLGPAAGAAVARGPASGRRRVGQSTRFAADGGGCRRGGRSPGCWRGSIGQPVLDLASYPVAAVDRLATTGRLGPGHRIAEIDVVGCYLIWRAGPATKVFIDDRYDMYPTSVTNADGRARRGPGRRAQGARHVPRRHGALVDVVRVAGRAPGRGVGGDLRRPALGRARSARGS